MSWSKEIALDFSFSHREVAFRDSIRSFIDKEVRHRIDEFEHYRIADGPWQPRAVVEMLKGKAKAAGLWNLFLPPMGSHVPLDDSFAFSGERLSNVEYALCAEEMGRIHWVSEVFNCSPPDTGNMEVLHRYGTLAQKERWLQPLMDGKIRSAFLMTEPDVASSDATNIKTSIRRDGDHYVVNGTKWWSSGAGDPRCKLAILMGKSDPDAERHRQQSMLIVPFDAQGLSVERTLTVFGYDHAPHGHAQIRLDNVRVPIENMILGEGRGFEIAQGRLGPGRIHHCMRAIGAAEEALDDMVKRLLTRSAFGKPLSEQSVWEQRVADARVSIDMTRLLCLKAADVMDRLGNKAARNEIAMIKVQAPRMALQVIDDAIQSHGGAGVSGDFGLADRWANIRTLRIVDGPDEVHRRAIARTEFSRERNRNA